MLTIDPSVYALVETGNREDLKTALQHAVALEHSTMPPYLYAWFSLGSSNGEIARVLKRIAVEEMLHMLLAGNMLKAIGGTPVIHAPEFVPCYPTHLPGTVAEELVVPLEPFSLTLTERVFMRIEQPEKPLRFETAEFALPAARTIGEFYRRIRQIFEQQGDSIIVDKTGATQPQTSRLPGKQAITTAAEAVKAIGVIIDQGEGTESSPFFPDGDDNPDNDRLAHYYLFSELVKGRLKRNPQAPADAPPEKRYVYDAGHPVPFNAAAVLRLPTNPKGSQYAQGSAARTGSDGFNRIYTDILRLLQESFTGNPSQLETAIDRMTELMDAGSELATVDVGDGTMAGPTFEFLA